MCPLVFKNNHSINGVRLKKGFSLIELLVVLVIISVFSAFVGPRVVGSLGNMSLKTSSKKVAAALRYARSRAVTESIPYVALFDLNRNRMTVKPNGSFTLKEDESGEEAPVKKGAGRSKRYILPEGIIFKDAVAVNGDKSDSRFFAIVFMPSGCSSGGIILLENRRERRYGIKVDFITGMVRLEAS